MSGCETITVEIAFATPDRQVLREVTVRAGASVADVLEQGNLAGEFPGLTLDNCQAGVWGRLVDRDHKVADKDRVELYRPLEIDPREARRGRALAGLTMADHDAD